MVATTILGWERVQQSLGQASARPHAPSHSPSPAGIGSMPCNYAVLPGAA